MDARKRAYGAAKLPLGFRPRSRASTQATSDDLLNLELYLLSRSKPAGRRNLAAGRSLRAKFRAPEDQMPTAALIAGLITVAWLAVASSAANAQASRTWVSGVGDDANPCTRTAPCKTFAGAFSKTAAGGEIDALDPGGFGAVTITKAITIDGGGGQVASVLVAFTNGIVVQGPSDVVTLRNLRIIGFGLNGIRFLSGRAINIQTATSSVSRRTASTSSARGRPTSAIPSSPTILVAFASARTEPALCWPRLNACKLTTTAVSGCGETAPAAPGLSRSSLRTAKQPIATTASSRPVIWPTSASSSIARRS